MFLSCDFMELTMRILYSLLLIVFSFSILSCPYPCEPDAETPSLPDTDFYIINEKETYSANEEFQIHFSSIPEFNYFGKYSFTISLMEYDTNTDQYEVTSNFIFCDKFEDLSFESFEYDKKDLKDLQTFTKTFSVKVLREGKFRCYINGMGCHFNDKGGMSAVGYSKCLYINVSRED